MLVLIIAIAIVIVGSFVVIVCRLGTLRVVVAVRPAAITLFLLLFISVFFLLTIVSAVLLSLITLVERKIVTVVAVEVTVTEMIVIIICADPAAFLLVTRVAAGETRAPKVHMFKIWSQSNLDLLILGKCAQ
jgi:hypothetical protein